MNRLKKIAYSYSQFLMDSVATSGKELLTVHTDKINKIGDSESESEQINVNLNYYIKKEDLEYVTGQELTEDQWNDFYTFIKAINVVDFDDLTTKIHYNAIDDINRGLPNEDISTYELESFKFNTTNQDYSDIDFKLEAKFTKIY